MRSILVTRQDFARLERMIETHVASRDRAAVVALEEELGHAKIVDAGQIPPDVVTMNSTVRFVDEQSGDEQEVTLVYPGAEDGAHPRVSILAPVGSALLGLRTGESIDWPMPDGQIKRLRVLSLVHQPEAAGEYHR
jgi:regulator of nucleoside diphosphate kinase